MFGYLEALDELKKRYTEGRVSALIGSGFSKNISSFFPLCDQLLADIVLGQNRNVLLSSKIEMSAF